MTTTYRGLASAAQFWYRRLPMMSAAAITFCVLGAVLVSFVLGLAPVEIVALGSALALYATGVLTIAQATAGFGDPTVIFIATLFVVSESLDATGVTTWVGEQLNAHTGDSRNRLMVLMMVLVATLTALISVNGAVAALLPVIVLMSVRRGPPSKLLMPLVFGSHAGSLLTLTGTPVNVLVSNTAASAGVGRFGFFEFAFVGAPLLIGCIAIVVWFGDRLLPSRNARVIPTDLSNHAKTLMQQYALIEGSTLFTMERGVAEFVIPPRSTSIGVTVFPGMTTSSGDLVIMGILRDDSNITKKTPLAAGDTVLLRGRWAALEDQAEQPNVLAVDAPDLLRRRAVPMGPKARRAIVILAVMVLVLATGALPELAIGLFACFALILLRVISVGQAYRSISWTTVVLVAAMVPLATAMRESGAAETLATGLVGIVGRSGPLALLAGLFLLTACLGQTISNMATALIVLPIAVSAAGTMGVSARPLLMTVAVASAAAFLTPVATPVNLMIQEPGGYRFSDYWKLGLPMLLWFFIVCLVIVPIVWPF